MTRYVFAIPNVRFNDRPLCFKSSRRYTVHVCAGGHFPGILGDESCDVQELVIEAIFCQDTGRYMEAGKLTPDAQKRLDASAWDVDAIYSGAVREVTAGERDRLGVNV